LSKMLLSRIKPNKVFYLFNINDQVYSVIWILRKHNFDAWSDPSSDFEYSVNNFFVSLNASSLSLCLKTAHWNKFPPCCILMKKYYKWLWIKDYIIIISSEFHKWMVALFFDPRIPNFTSHQPILTFN